MAEVCAVDRLCDEDVIDAVAQRGVPGSGFEVQGVLKVEAALTEVRLVEDRAHLDPVWNALCSEGVA